MAYFCYIGGGITSIVFGDFASHPMCMATAFLLFGTLSVASSGICAEHDVDPDKAKWIHIVLNTIVLVFAWTGWEVIYELHNSSGSHYKGSHSRVGVFTLCMWVVYYISDFCILIFAPKQKLETKQANNRLETLQDVHFIFGTMCIILAMWTMALGLMWEEYSYDVDEDTYARLTSDAVMISIMLIIFLIFGMMTFGRILCGEFPK